MRGVKTYLLLDVPLLSDPLFLSFLVEEPPDLTSLSTLRFCEPVFIFDFRAVLAVSPLNSRLDTNLSEAGADDRWFVMLLSDRVTDDLLAKRLSCLCEGFERVFPV